MNKYKALLIAHFITAQVTQKQLHHQRLNNTLFITAQVTQKSKLNHLSRPINFITAQVTQKID